MLVGCCKVTQNMTTHHHYRNSINTHQDTSSVILEYPRIPPPALAGCKSRPPPQPEAIGTQTAWTLGSSPDAVSSLRRRRGHRLMRETPPHCLHWQIDDVA